MNLRKSQMLLAVSILLSLLGMLLFNIDKVANPAHAEIAPTSTPRRIAPTATPRRSAPGSPPFQVFLPLVASSPLDSFTLINLDLQAGVIDVNQATTYKFYALFKSPLLPSQYQSVAPIPYDGMGAFVDTLSNWNQLNSTTQQTLSDFLTPRDISGTLAPSSHRPSVLQPPQQVVGCNLTEVKPTAHFVIRYAISDTLCKVSSLTYPDYVATGLEDAWNVYSGLGYTMPLSTSVWLVPIANLKLPILNLQAPPAMSLLSGILFASDLQMPSPAMEAMAAHEFFHQVQWKYFGLSCPSYPLGAPWFVNDAWWNNEDVRWWMEASAQWAQHEVYSNDSTYFESIAAYLNNPWTHLDTRPREGGTAFPYGSVLFPIYLSERLPAHGALIKTTWERYSQLNNGCGTMMPALQSALQTQSTTMGQIFPAFSEANYSLAYQNQADFRTVLRDGPNYRPNPESAPLDDQALTTTGPVKRDGRESIEHLGAAYVEFQNLFPQPPIGRALTVTVDLYVNNPSADPVVKLWAVSTWNPPTVISKTITPYFQLAETITPTKHYVAKAGVPGFDSYQWVAMDLVNPQTSGSAMTYTYSAGVVPPAAIYAGEGSKAFVSRTSGVSWITYTFPSTLTVQAVAAVTNTQGLVGYAATSDLKLWKTADGGQTFNPVFDFAPKVQGYITNSVFSLITVDPTISNTVYAGLIGAGATQGKGALYKSSDQGQTFGSDLLTHCHTSHPPGEWNDCIITSLAVDPTNSNILWIGQNGWNAVSQTVMRSTNGGQTWQSMINTHMSQYTVVSISKSNPNVIWVFAQEGISGEWVLRTPNSGTTWNAANVGNMLNPASRVILSDPYNASSAWATSALGELKHSQDANVSWQSLAGSFHALEIIAPQNLIGMSQWESGIQSIQWSFDAGRTWLNIGTPAMPGAGVLSVVLR